VTGWAEAAGFGRDREGDARRREELSGAVITPQMVAAIREAENRLLAATFAVPPERVGVDPRVPEEEPYPAPVVAGHELSAQRGLSGTGVTCE
jgi:hypothetical protein